MGVAGWATALWGVGGVLLLLAQALVRLTPLAIEPVAEGQLSVGQGVLYAGWVVTNAYAEGYRGFQRRFSPRVVGRAVWLASHRKPLHVIFAPLYCMSFFHATRRGRITAWVFTGVLVAVIAVVKLVPQPWRGIIDGGVVVGLLWGAASIVVLLVQAAVRGRCPAPSDLP